MEKMTKKEIQKLLKRHSKNVEHLNRELEIRKKQAREIQIEIIEEHGKIYELLQQIEKFQKEESNEKQ